MIVSTAFLRWPGSPLESLFAVLVVSNSNRRSSVSRYIKRTLELRWPRLLFHIERDYRKDSLRSSIEPLDSFHDGFPKEVSVSTAPQ